MKHQIGLLAVVLLGVTTFNPTSSQAQSVAVEVHGGSQGVGLGLIFPLSDQAHIRLIGGQYSVEESVSTDAVTYDGDFDFGSVLALVDWYPTGGGFRISGGIGWNNNQIQVTAPLEELVRDQLPNLPPFDFELGIAAGSAQGEDIVGTLLLGWGNPTRGSRLGVMFDIGVLYQGEPTVELEARPTPEVDAIPGAREILQAIAEVESANLEAELADYQWIPVVSLGIVFRF